MPQVINTHMASLNAQRTLNRPQDALGVSLQRLSSGLRIDSAKDDAAGLAISERFTTQIRGMSQAMRNSNDAISMAQTAEGSLGELTNNLQRVRELAVQSANATNSSSERAALQNEVSQLVSEIDRVAQQTKFNGVSLLDGSFVNQTFQVGADAGQTISISSMANVRTSALGASYSANRTSTAVTSTALSSGNLILNGVTVGASTSDGVSFTNVSASAIARANAINIASGHNITAVADSNSVTSAAVAITVSGATPANAGLTAGTTASSQTGVAVSNLNISTVSGANPAILSVDAALNTVNTSRAELGAYQNRFSSVVAKLQTTSENLTSSRSRIQDADFASETASLTRGQILQQAGIAILAQANSLPQSVLQLMQ